MITLSTKVKMGAITRKVEVSIFNAKDVAQTLGITNVAVITAAQKANVGVKDAGSMFFTAEDIEVLKARPGRGRPVGSVKVQVQAPEVHVDPLDVNEGNYLGEGNNIIDLGGEEEEEDKAAAN